MVLRSNWRSFSAAVAAFLVPQPALVAAELNPGEIGWYRLEMTASKLFMQVRTEAELAVLDHEELGDELTGAGEGEPVAVSGEVTRMTFRFQGLGRNSLTTLYIDADSGAALQRVQEDSGRKLRHRIYRFTDAGAYHFTSYPAKGEEGLPDRQWTDKSEGFRPYPPDAVGQIVTDPTALLYVAAATKWAEPGDKTSILTFARRKVARVDLKLAGTESMEVDFQLDEARYQATVPALRILVDPDPIGDAEDDDFEFLGLRDDIEILLDPETGIPLQLHGKAPVVGMVTFRLTSASRGQRPLSLLR